jgi:hypothetical protein
MLRANPNANTLRAPAQIVHGQRTHLLGAARNELQAPEGVSTTPFLPTALAR